MSHADRIQAIRDRLCGHPDCLVHIDKALAELQDELETVETTETRILAIAQANDRTPARITLTAS